MSTIVSQNMTGGELRDMLEAERAKRRFKKHDRTLEQELAADHGWKSRKVARAKRSSNSV